MNKIIAIRYIDAFYFKEKKLGNHKLVTHYSIGKLASVSRDFVVLCFTEKDGIPWEGLLLPREAFVFDKKNEMSESVSVKSKIKKIKKNTPIGVFWKDLVHFENGVLPPLYSLMYTEGKVHSITSKVLIIKNPETINITPGKLANHPKGTAYISFLVIPICFITNVEIYDK